MSFQEGTQMASDPREKYRRQERRLHCQSLVVQRFGRRTSGAAIGAGLGLRIILALTAVTGEVVLVLGAGQLFNLVVWLAVTAALTVAMGCILVNYKREVKSADEELRKALSSTDEDQCQSEAHS